MSVAECKLRSNRQAPMRQVAKERDCPGALTKTHQRDILKMTNTKDVCRLARHLATLLRAGMPLVPALSALVEQLRAAPKLKLVSFGPQGNALAAIMDRVADDVRAGSALSMALGKHPDVFSSLFINIVAAGEASGSLEDALLRLAEMLEKRMHLSDKVKSAIAYPLMLVMVATCVVVFLLSYVVPSITQIFLEMNRVLPWPTKLLISISHFMKSYFLLIAIVVCAAFFGIAVGYRTKEGRLFADRSKLRLPLFGKLFLKLEIARLTRTLGILLVSGISIINALEIAKRVIQNSFIAGALDSVKDQVTRGDNIANAIRKTGLFPPIVFHIIATGQISGEIETGLLNIADMYDGEVETTAKTLTSLLEPAILLFIGTIIGFMVLAILLPIFEIGQVI